MDYQNSIAKEISALQYLNRFLVVSVYDNVAEIDARIRNGILQMQESGIQKEVCVVFRRKHYEETNQHLFKEICDAISEEHIPAIKEYLEDLANQYYQATGTSIEVGQFLTFPDPSQSANVPAPLTERNSSVSDYALQCDAICDFTDFLAQQTEELDLVLQGYTNCCNDLLNCGVPIQVRDHYVETYAVPLGNAINYKLREALTEAYKYLVEVYDLIVVSMNKIGLSVNRAPRALAVSSCGGEGSASSATTSNNVVQSPVKNEKEDQAVQAREQNVKEMEKYFGKPNPEIRHNIAKADMQNANPHYGERDKYGVKKDEYKINCATCALAYALRRCFGFDVTAKGNTKKENNLNYWLSFDNILEVVKKADGSPVKASYLVDWMKRRKKDRLYAEDYEDFFEEVCDKEGVYIFALTWYKDRVRHATILERDEKGLHWIEPQVYKEDVSDVEGKRKIRDLTKELWNFPYTTDGILRWDEDMVLDVEEKSFYIPNEVKMLTTLRGEEQPEPMELVQENTSYDESNGKVIKMRFTDLFSVN